MTSVRKFRTKTSQRFCSEKLCCRSETTIANNHCVDCGTDQCEDCSEAIHSANVSFEFHEKRPIEKPPVSDLCDIKCVLPSKSCIQENFADLWCEVCCARFCNYCFDNYHKLPSKKTHRKISFKEHQSRELLLYEQSQMNIQPLSPISDDDSLTYVSFPQEEASTTMINSTRIHPVNIPDLCAEASCEDLVNDLAESMLDSENEEVSSFMLIDDQESLKVHVNM